MTEIVEPPDGAPPRRRRKRAWYAGVALSVRRLIRPANRDHRALVVSELDGSSSISLDYVVLVCLSCVIATYGLILNSAAVVIGAMLVAPLMSPILAIALAGVRRDLRRWFQAARAIAAGVLLALGLSILLGQAVTTGDLNLLEDLPTEVLSRTRPTQFDLVVALAGGATAAYALSRPKLSATLPGVAIATALMPPLCAAGIGVALGRSDVASGAFFLFVGNLVAITIAAATVFAFVGFRPELGIGRWSRQSLPALAISATMLLVLAMPLFWYLKLVADDIREDMGIRSALAARLATIPNASLVGFVKREERGQVTVTATVRAARDLTFDEALEMQREIASPLGKAVALKLLIERVALLDPILLPTPTLTPTLEPQQVAALPTFTATPTPTVMATPVMSTPAGSPPAVASPVSNPLNGIPMLGDPPVGGPSAASLPPGRRLPISGTPVPIPTPISTLSVTPTLTPTPAATPMPSPTETPPTETPPTETPRPTATPVSYAVVSGTDGLGANVYRMPGVTTPVTAISDGTVVELTGRVEDALGLSWTEVVLQDGRVGWIGSDYLVPRRTFRAP